jgi:hypothetical protein
LVQVGRHGYHNAGEENPHHEDVVSPRQERNASSNKEAANGDDNADEAKTQ